MKTELQKLYDYLVYMRDEQNFGTEYHIGYKGCLIDLINYIKNKQMFYLEQEAILLNDEEIEKETNRWEQVNKEDNDADAWSFKEGMYAYRDKLKSKATT